MTLIDPIKNDLKSPIVSNVERTVAKCQTWFLEQQNKDGHWAFELEADATIPAEYILLNHFLGEVDSEIEVKLANYLREIQGAHGGWPLYHDGDFNIEYVLIESETGEILWKDPDYEK